MVEITFVKLTDDVPFNSELIKHTSFERRVRISKHRNEADKKRSLIAELLIRKAAYEKLMIPIDKVKISYNPYGKPYIANARKFKFNVSHSGSYVVIAVSEYGVGIDIEKIREIDMGIAQRFFTKNEYSFIESLASEVDKKNVFYMYWTLKESYIKAIGKGLNIPLNSFEFAIGNNISLNHQRSKGKYCFTSTTLNGYAVSLSSKSYDLKYKYIYTDEADIYNYYKSIVN